MVVGTLEVRLQHKHKQNVDFLCAVQEIIDDNHAIVSSSAGSEYYVTMLSFVDKDQLEPNCSVSDELLLRSSCSCASLVFSFGRCCCTTKC
jgi:ATP-dependent 26S proteasome regulatory subunit